MTWSPPESPDPEKSRAKTVIFEGSKIMAASLASALHPLSKRIRRSRLFKFIINNQAQFNQHGQKTILYIRKTVAMNYECPLKFKYWFAMDTGCKQQKKTCYGCLIGHAFN